MHIQRNIPASSPNPRQELIEILYQNDHIRVERIISNCCPSPNNFWYDQETDEWVMILEGEAGLSVDGEKNIVELHTGESIFLPAHKKHRVEWTSERTVWLTVHSR
jgi:cupin 2 domain-containing protein